MTMKPRRSRIRVQDPDAPSYERMSNEHHGCNSNCPLRERLETAAPWPHTSPLRKAHPENLLLHDVYRILCYGPSRHSRNGHAQSETCAESGSGCTVTLVDPVRKNLAKGLEAQGKKTHLFVDVLQWSVGMLAVTDTMTSHTCLAGIFFALDQHLGVVGGC